MQALSGKQAELQRQYGDDKEGYQEAFMKLQKENGAGGLSGCLLPFLQLFFIWPIYRIVSGPLIYLSQVSKENVQSMIDLGNRFGGTGLFDGRISVDMHSSLRNVSTRDLSDSIRWSTSTSSEWILQLHPRGILLRSQKIPRHIFPCSLSRSSLFLLTSQPCS